MITNKLWGGRFANTTDKTVEEFTASITFDKALAYEDIVGSMAHVLMLGKTGILQTAEVAAILAALKKIALQIANQAVEFNIADEDIHMNIERLLHNEIGAIAGKLHTARSRNDQIALDLRLYLRSQVILILNKLIILQQTLLEKAKQYVHVIMPGYTHLQRAQPVLFSHHLLAYVAMLERDLARLQDGWMRINQLPLGAGALAGTGFPIDRDYVAKLLHFDGVCQNSLDAVSDRDFIIEFLADAALIMQHLSRFSEELILWSSQEFNFIELSDAYCTGSSIMPQKKNPDVPELVRAKTGRVYGALFNLLTMMKGLPLAYNKDLQEDKEPLFDVVNTLQTVLAIYAPLLESVKINEDKMLQATYQGFINATDLADYLVRKGLPFRQAHEVVGKIVQHCVLSKNELLNLSLELLQQYSPLITEDVFAILQMQNIVNVRNSDGGTATQQVLKQIENATSKLSTHRAWLNTKEKVLTQNILQELVFQGN